MGNRTKILKIFAVLLFIQMYNNSRNRCKLKRKAIVDVEHSVWRKLLESDDESSFLKMTGFTYGAFNILVHLVKEFTGEEVPVGVKRGRPKLLTTEDEVG
jgi:hypothetical protein